MSLLVGGEELRHVLRGDLVHVAGGVEVALRVVEGAVGGAFFGVCAVPRFAEVLCAAVDAAERGFDGALVCVGCAAVGVADCLVPFVVYEAGAVAFDADGDGHLVVVADVFGEVSLLFVGEAVPRVGERGHDRVVGGAREARGEAASAILLMLVFMVLLLSCWVVFFVCVYCSTLVGACACPVVCLFAACVRGLRHACTCVGASVGAGWRASGVLALRWRVGGCV